MDHADFAADNRRKLKIIAAIVLPCFACLGFGQFLVCVGYKPPPSPEPTARPAVVLAMAPPGVPADAGPPMTKPRDEVVAAPPAPAQVEAPAPEDAAVAAAQAPPPFDVAGLLARATVKTDETYDPAHAVEYDQQLQAIEAEFTSIPAAERAAHRRELHRAEAALTRRRRAIRREVEEQQGRAIALEMCGPTPPERVDASGRLMYQRGFFMLHRRDPDEEILRCAPPTLAGLQCWRSVCVTRSFATANTVEFLWRRGEWYAMRYLR